MMLLPIGHHTHRRWRSIFIFLLAATLLYALIDTFNLHSQLRTPPGPPTVNLILATLSLKPHRWTEHLSIPNLTVIPYIADDPNAVYHPPANKGNEAISYLTYLHDFYDNLSDISIFIHGSDSSWHIDGVLEQSTKQALNRLDLAEVWKRGYLNLRTSWESACPVWINTSVTLNSSAYDEKLRPEEPYIRGAIQDIFPGRKIPRGLASPCCSQFTITKDRIRSIPKHTYKRAIEWLLNTELESRISGRVWEHLWHWLFLGKDIDCPSEWRALCVWYHVCFENEGDWMGFKEMDASKYEFLRFKQAKLRNGLQMGNRGVVGLQEGVRKIEGALGPWRQKAIERGRDEGFRRMVKGSGDL
ncbi:uncharacterized protein PAC_00240 [Phialocephala subalpina]|uniref:Uncharacterized protein n=1 Tax=Phialocephala subalpina TaxID=576137 RepID=A0A1L7WC79_9HELO|nr:uncharacterized protein PAC_00240 [Phialocephala subalpina]